MADTRGRLKELASTPLSALQKIEYNGPSRCADFACKYFPDNREDVVVLDVAAGIGLVAQEMQKRGFRIFYGIDQSSWMLEKAKELNIYSQLNLKGLTSAKTCIKNDTFDLVTACGACDRIPYDAVKEMIRVTKPGGFICIVNRRSTFNTREEYSQNFFPLCDQLEQEGIWTKQEITPFAKFLGNEEGLAIVYRVN